eukprot:6481652-Lingulodinium_polyedra.AAC.1
MRRCHEAERRGAARSATRLNAVAPRAARSVVGLLAEVRVDQGPPVRAVVPTDFGKLLHIFVNLGAAFLGLRDLREDLRELHLQLGRVGTQPGGAGPRAVLLQRLG